MSYLVLVTELATCALCLFTGALQRRILRTMAAHKREHEAQVRITLEHAKLHDRLHATAHIHVTPPPEGTIRA